MKQGFKKFKLGGLHQKHEVATCGVLGMIISIRLYTQGNQEKPVPR